MTIQQPPRTRPCTVVGTPYATYNNNSASAPPTPIPPSTTAQVELELLEGQIGLPYVAHERPQTLSEMHGITGVGERKLEQYGQAFLELVRYW